MKLCQGTFRLRLLGKGPSPTERVLRHKNRLPREAVMAPSLSELKKYLDKVLKHTV